MAGGEKGIKMKKILVIMSMETEEIFKGLEAIAEFTREFEVCGTNAEKANQDKFDVVVFNPYWKKDNEIAENAAEMRIAIIPHPNGIIKLKDFKLPFPVSKEYVYCERCNGMAFYKPHKVASEIAMQLLNC